MRLWSLHPKYLDTKGLVSAWREGLLALKVLEGNTRGYKNHPQLIRFKKCSNPIKAINNYLWYLLDESLLRGYLFNKEKINIGNGKYEEKIIVTKGQVEYEMKLLLRKLEKRDINVYEEVVKIQEIEVNSIFRIIEGGIAEWEKVKELE